jgi:hypothetical protein
LRRDIGEGLPDAVSDAFHADALQTMRRQNIHFPAEQPLKILREAEKAVVQLA